MGAKIYQNKKYIAFFLIPAFVFMLIFLYYPFIQNIINSFQHIKYMGTAADKWNAPFYKNYLEIFKDPKMLIALKNTGIMIIATIVIIIHNYYLLNIYILQYIQHIFKSV